MRDRSYVTITRLRQAPPGSDRRLRDRLIGLHQRVDDALHVYQQIGGSAGFVSLFPADLRQLLFLFRKPLILETERVDDDQGLCLASSCEVQKMEPLETPS